MHSWVNRQATTVGLDTRSLHKRLQVDIFSKGGQPRLLSLTGADRHLARCGDQRKKTQPTRPASGPTWGLCDKNNSTPFPLFTLAFLGTIWRYS